MNTASLLLTEHQFAIEGMACASCVTRVEKALKAVSGVNEVCNMTTERATVNAVAPTSGASLAAAVEKAGYLKLIAMASNVALNILKPSTKQSRIPVTTIAVGQCPRPSR